MSIIDPKRADMIATMAETTVPKAVLRNIYERMKRDSTGQKLLRTRPRISGETIDREYIRSLPDGTLGASMLVQFIDDEELVYVMQRYRETHDFTTLFLKCLGLPMCILAAIFGGIRLSSQHKEQLLKCNLPWVVQQANNSRFLLAVDWENRYEQKKKTCNLNSTFSHLVLLV
uniref:Uncharacterized protein n=1 Tax=Ditylenchus dipsaci TaxID=166011 RepID=A0A915E5W4_9BILA